MTEPTFKRPELEDKEIISSYFEKAQSRSCERTFVNVYLWSRHYKVQYAIIEDTLVFRDSGKNLSFTYPAGEPENVKKALEFLMEYCKEKDVPFILYNVTPHMFAQLDKWYPKKFFIEYNRDLADYVYETEKLASLAGKKLHDLAYRSCHRSDCMPVFIPVSFSRHTHSNSTVNIKRPLFQAYQKVSGYKIHLLYPDTFVFTYIPLYAVFYLHFQSALLSEDQSPPTDTHIRVLSIYMLRAYDTEGLRLFPHYLVRQ